ncbi:MAG TPA: multifunctional oxoglutarate decarboxylase/oxoglutarate dehydrogenase thiamine pyrophosphate-binding subunit/dihydrolipoyllysine-residue succinyltransferase subunit [Planctomycetes bacterium]|nr:multifunctional oxoglutarate decarboxylase/oxoglutarate dehydrogenase thiamine pyrophosphate-binding subunit/dihydrolipoyllysine-residue succinyltransferase subunit [Planctomycetota bacterium]
MIDFEEQFGVNAAYVASLFEKWQSDPQVIDEEWRQWFESMGQGEGSAKPTKRGSSPAQSKAESRPEPAEAAPSPKKESSPASDLSSEEAEFEPLRGLARKIATNMNASLSVPTATSVRTIPVKVLDENRKILNAHLRVRALGKASYTHLIAFALIRALREHPGCQAFYTEREGKAFKARPKHINLGLAIDVATPDGRMLVVPNIKRCEELSFAEFLLAYEDIVQRGREGKLSADDFKNTTVSLTNPGGFGTTMSVPRLMEGQGLIIGTGSIGVPVHARAMSPDTVAEAALGPVMTITSTYDHRTVQGAESGLLLRRMEELLQGADGFYEEIFAEMRVPWTPWAAQKDQAQRGSEAERAEKQVQIWQLINAYRVRGFLLADLDPLEYAPTHEDSLDVTTYGFTIWDLDRKFLAGDLCGKPWATLREILEVLRETYCRRWSIEYMHISNRERKHWIRARVEGRRNEEVFSHEDRVRILERLVRAENFERFLHTRYPGNKRFSLEGADTLIPALAELIDRLAEQGVERIVLGMAHRGRLNVLANIQNKSFEAIFREFEGVLLPKSSEGSGDVKYHLGAKGIYVTPSGKQCEVILSANPSHLEAVDPVVQGMCRGLQDLAGDRAREKTVAVLVHGDAAFTGQGVVAETLQMSNLPAFSVGGTVHIVVNNQIGFTAGPKDLYSTTNPTDLAKMIEAPILHANGDNPESVLRGIHVAADYRHEFKADVVLNMVCYRLRGHNEGDEPLYTQPLLYKKIAKHPTVREHYIDLLVRRGAMSREEAESISNDFDKELRAALEASRNQAPVELPDEEVLELCDHSPKDYAKEASVPTGLPQEQLVSIIEATNTMPEGLVVHPNLLGQLRRREDMVQGKRGIDWGCAETLAFGSILQEGISIRIAGQDSGRGTFSHRHAVIRDQVTGEDWIPLKKLAAKGRSFQVWDSLLAEEAVLGFEYGNALVRPRDLNIWEAQFGDFVNGAQIPIDQFLASSETKWGQTAGLVLLLPHGYDGQGPEHSSARPERFLQLSAQGNWTVANCTTSAQYFHLLRRQGKAETKRPLVVLTPKSLLRDRRAASDRADFGPGTRFHEVLPETQSDPAKVKRHLFCSGKVYYDLLAHREKSGREDTAITRIEQLYPFPLREVQAEIDRFGAETLVFVQEEPKNMGAWWFLRMLTLEQGIDFEYAGRPPSTSPATGSYKRHQKEQDFLVRRAFGEAAEQCPVEL